MSGGGAFSSALAFRLPGTEAKAPRDDESGANDAEDQMGEGVERLRKWLGVAGWVGSTSLTGLYLNLRRFPSGQRRQRVFAACILAEPRTWMVWPFREMT